MLLTHWTTDTRWTRRGLGVAWAAQLGALELVVRGPTVLLTEPAVAGGLVSSWALLMLAERVAQRRVARALVALTVASLWVAELAYCRYYGAPLDAQVAVSARHAWSDVGPLLLRAVPVLGLGVSILAVVEYLLLGFLRAPGIAGSWLLAMAFAGVVCARSPRLWPMEMRAAHALWVLSSTRESMTSRERSRLPELESRREQLPDVLLMLTESVRASDACLDRGCVTSPELDRALPDRVSFAQARALSSYTAIALSALVTGRVPTERRAELARAPDLFDIARAVRARGQSYSIRYWSSQLAAVFERGELSSVADQVETADSFLGRPASDIEDSVAAGLDRRVAEHCEREVARVPGPRFVVIHLAGTHAPYFFDPARAPFQPWQQQVVWSGLRELHHAYLNALLEQDRSVARCLKAFLRGVGEKPWVFLYTSDHGEAFGEHQAIHHGQNLYDEQLHVPWLVAHGGRALTAEQAEQLSAAAKAAVTHLDLLPTLLDVWGVRGHLGLVAWTSKLHGRSLLRPLSPLQPVPITNCTDLFPCPLNTWGVLGETKKLTAQSWDGNWRCLSLEGGERERALGECASLVEVSTRYFPHLPNGRPNQAEPNR